MNWLERAIQKGKQQREEWLQKEKEAELSRELNEKAEKIRKEQEQFAQEQAIWIELGSDLSNVQNILHQFEVTPGWKVSEPTRTRISLTDTLRTFDPKYISSETTRHEYPEPSGKDEVSYSTHYYVETVARHVTKDYPTDDKGRPKHQIGIHLFTSQENETICLVSGSGAERFTPETLISLLESRVEQIIASESS